MSSAAWTGAQIWSFGRIGWGFAQLGRRWYSSERLAWALIGLGVLLRVAQYAANRSLWFDESALTLNILNRSLAGLLQPLDYAQGAPVGFLILEKLIVQAGGDSEYVLRLVPLISGILALPLFYRVARHAIRPGAVPIALGLFAILDALVYYASEVKQYSSDVTVTLAVFASAQAVFGRGAGLSVPRALVLGLIGGAALWFSHPATFVLMGVGTAALFVSCGDRDWARIGRLAIAVLIWIVSFSLLYYVSLRHLRTNEALLRYWAGAFLPFPPSLATVQWLGGNTLFKVLEYPVGLVRPGIGVGALALLVGAIALWTEDRPALLALLSPFVFTLAASAFSLYPFGDRLLLFGVPFIVLLIGEGAERVIAASKPHVPMIGVLLVGLLVLHPALSSVSHLIKPRTVQETRPVIAYVRAHRQNGDALYLYYGAVPAFKYYARRYGFAEDSYVEGVDANRRRIAADLDRLRGKRRAWMLFAHIDRDEQDFLLSHLDGRGTRLDSFQRDGAGVYLYDLSRNGNGSSYWGTSPVRRNNSPRTISPAPTAIGTSRFAPVNGSAGRPFRGAPAGPGPVTPDGLPPGGATSATGRGGEGTTPGGGAAGDGPGWGPGGATAGGAPGAAGDGAAGTAGAPGAAATAGAAAGDGAPAG